MKNNNLTILIDIDDVLINLCEAWCNWLSNQYNLNVSVTDIIDWEIEKFFPSLSKTQVFEPLHNIEFWETVHPKYEAIEYVKRLMDDGHNIYLCTATDYRNVRVKYGEVILRYFPYIAWDHVIVTSHKQMIKADILIDDGVHNLENGDYVKILMSAPHNQNYNAEKNGMIRAESWKSIYELICNNIESETEDA